MSKLPLSYYKRNDVVLIAKSLLGKSIFTNMDGRITGGVITETEAYNGIIDKASHSYAGKRTDRTEVMYQEGGITYVYLCYGIHFLLNIVTSLKNIPHAVLIRGIYPIKGIDHMLERTGKVRGDYKLTNGPGKVTKALGINKSHNGLSYGGDKIWIEDNGWEITDKDITSGPRVGVAYAEEDALLPYRFIIKHKLIQEIAI